jgi:uncharacterized protein
LSSASTEVRIPVGDESVAGLLRVPKQPIAGYVMAHGAGAGMRHSFMEAMASDLTAAHVATLRYDFPYMEEGRKRPDPPPVAKATVRAAVTAAAKLMPGLALFAGGKSFGGRMTSEAQASEPLSSVKGLVFLGFPLHPAKQPAPARGAHLSKVSVPMLFLQGERDALAELPLLHDLLAKLGPGATAQIIPHADHSFHVPAKSGRSDPEIRAELARMIAGWMKVVLRV